MSNTIGFSNLVSVFMCYLSMIDISHTFHSKPLQWYFLNGSLLNPSERILYYTVSSEEYTQDNLRRVYESAMYKVSHPTRTQKRLPFQRF